MSTVTHLVDRADFSFSTPLIDAAAALETALQDSERRAQTLTRQLHWAQTRQGRTRLGLLALRRSLRTSSHHKTTRLLKRILIDLATPLNPDDTTHIPAALHRRR